MIEPPGRTARDRVRQEKQARWTGIQQVSRIQLYRIDPRESAGSVSSAFYSGTGGLVPLPNRYVGRLIWTTPDRKFLPGAGRLRLIAIPVCLALCRRRPRRSIASAPRRRHRGGASHAPPIL